MTNDTDGIINLVVFKKIAFLKFLLANRVLSFSEPIRDAVTFDICKPNHILLQFVTVDDFFRKKLAKRISKKIVIIMTIIYYKSGYVSIIGHLNVHYLCI